MTSDILDPRRNAERREAIAAGISRSLGVSGNEATRHAAVEDRLENHPTGPLPARGQLPAEDRIALFETKAKAVDAGVVRVKDMTGIPDAVVTFLCDNNLPPAIRHGGDCRLRAIPWDQRQTLEVSEGIAHDETAVGVSHAFGAVAESGTLILVSGPQNPTTLNFLPETHIVIVRAPDIAGDYETVLQRLRESCPDGNLPRTVNMITGPSRSADIEQTLLLGAHGPKRLHIIIIG